MTNPQIPHQMETLTAEAARIFCEEGLWDYRSAKLKALRRLGLPPRTSLPDNQRLQQAVIDHQQLFGGSFYRKRLRHLRETALQAMHLLAAFDPRLTGAAVSGAISDGHRLQLHVFADMPEAIDLFMESQHIPYAQDERRYRYADGTERIIPLTRFEAGDVGIDVAVFDPEQGRQPPLSASDGLPMRRLRAEQVRALLDRSVADDAPPVPTTRQT